MKMSVAIPCWSMNGRGVEVLEYSFNILQKQTLKDFEVVITDHSIDNNIEILCDGWKDRLNINYIRNEQKRGFPAQNTNLGFFNCKGEYIKSLCQDDYLYSENSLQILYDRIKSVDGYWLMGAYMHTNDRITNFREFIPSLNQNIHYMNTLGTHSALTIRNYDLLEFDETLKYYYDCEYYYRLWKRNGDPIIVNEITMVNYLHSDQTTNSIMTQELINIEMEYVRKKHC